MPFPKRKDPGPLHDLLMKCCPPDRRGNTSVILLARAFKPPVSRFTIYKWEREGKVPPDRALELVDIAASHRSDVTLAQFTPFVYVPK